MSDAPPLGWDPSLIGDPSAATQAVADALSREVDRIRGLPLDLDGSERLVLACDLALTGSAVMLFARAADGCITVVNLPWADVAILSDPTRTPRPIT